MKATIKNLGCKVNAYEAEFVRRILEKNGFIIGDNAEADVYIINTCTVTNTSDSKSRKLIRKIRREHENAILVVMGCALENTKEIYSKIEFYDLAHKQIIPRVPYNWNNIHKFESAPAQYPYIEKFENSPYEDDRFFISSILTKANQLGILDKVHWQRIEDECGEIWEVSEKIEERLSAYFLTIQKVVDIGWNEGDTLMGPWRGSAGALLTAYLLDITQRDPLESPIELPYWR